MGLAGTHPSGLPFFCPNGDHLTQPPPAHMGIPPYGALDAGKAAAAAGKYFSLSFSSHPYIPRNVFLLYNNLHRLTSFIWFIRW